MAAITFTGFGVWGNTTMNPSWESIKNFRPEMPDDFIFQNKHLPVLWGVANLHLIPTLLDDTRYLISFGLAEDRDTVCLEQFAYNERDNSLEDASGLKPDEQKIDPDGPDKLEVDLPLNRIETKISELEIPVRISEDPGRFICNETLYSGLLHAKRNEPNLKVGFVHVPPIRHLDDKKWKALPEAIIGVLMDGIKDS